MKKKIEQNTDEPKFEVALSRLEKLAEQMESGELGLEDALKQYEEGVGLARFCNQKLNEIQKRIDILKKDADGQWTRVPLDAEETLKDTE